MNVHSNKICELWQVHIGLFVLTHIDIVVKIKKFH